MEGKLTANHFSNANANNIFTALDYGGKYNVKLPKFKMTQSIDPKDLLKKLGKLRSVQDNIWLTL